MHRRYTEPKTLPDLLKKLGSVQEPSLGLAPDVASFEGRRDFVVNVAQAVAEWVQDEALLILEASRAEPGAQPVMRRAEGTGDDVFTSIRDGIGAYLDDAIEAAAELARHPDQYTAIAAE